MQMWSSFIFAIHCIPLNSFHLAFFFRRVHHIIIQCDKYCGTVLVKLNSDNPTNKHKNKNKMRKRATEVFASIHVMMRKSKSKSAYLLFCVCISCERDETIAWISSLISSTWLKKEIVCAMYCALRTTKYNAYIHNRGFFLCVSHVSVALYACVWMSKKFLDDINNSTACTVKRSMLLWCVYTLLL